MALRKANSRESRGVITDREYRLPFSTYQGWTIDEVLKSEQPGYLVWLVDNTDRLDLHHSLYEEAELDAEYTPWQILSNRPWHK